MGGGVDGQETCEGVHVWGGGGRYEIVHSNYKVCYKYFINK